MTIKSLIETLSDYDENTEVKIVVDDKDSDIRCLIYNKDFNTLVLADSSYES